MIYPEDIKKADESDTTAEQRLVLDGTANLDYADDEPVPRIKGLIELLQQYFAGKSDSSR